MNAKVKLDYKTGEYYLVLPPEVVNLLKWGDGTKLVVDVPTTHKDQIVVHRYGS
jgi:hypothetical protein